MPMHWIIQEDMYREDGYTSLLDTMQRFDLPHTVIKVVPFSENASECEQTIPAIPPLQGLVMVCGSTTLAKIAARRGWTPGSFHNDQHDYRCWQVHYGRHLLNADARVCRFADVQVEWSPFFIRPCEDSKTFSGTVHDAESFAEWRHKVLDLGTRSYTSLNAETMVAYSPVQTIYTESRFFVVDGAIVGQSVYKVGSRVVYQPNVDDDVVAFARSMIGIWQPGRAFAIDIARTEAGLRVIEINCINSAGFYAINVQRFVEAIEAMAFD